MWKLAVEDIGKLMLMLRYHDYQNERNVLFSKNNRIAFKGFGYFGNEENIK